MSSVVIHPQYYPPGVFYDLALLQLDAAADITKNNIGLECLPDSRGESYVVDQCVVTGWGKETFGASGISAILKKIQVRSLNHSFYFLTLYIVHCTVRFLWWITSHASLSSRTRNSDPGKIV